jgi:hypothetical protein
MKLNDKGLLMRIKLDPQRLCCQEALTMTDEACCKVNRPLLMTDKETNLLTITSEVKAKSSGDKCMKLKTCDTCRPPTNHDFGNYLSNAVMRPDKGNIFNVC